MHLPERLKYARESLGLSQTAIAHELGISHRSWQSYELGKSFPGGQIFVSLCELGFNGNWLLLGVGNMFAPHEDAAIGAVSADLSGYVFLPRYAVVGSAGGGTVIADEGVVDWIAFEKEWINRYIKAASKSLAIITVDGDSMSPTLNPGDMLIVNRNIDRVSNDGLYALQFSGHLVVKRIQIMASGDVHVISDNPAYKPDVLTGSDRDALIVVGRVVWAGKRM